MAELENKQLIIHQQFVHFITCIDEATCGWLWSTTEIEELSIFAFASKTTLHTCLESFFFVKP